MFAFCQRVDRNDPALRLDWRNTYFQDFKAGPRHHAYGRSAGNTVEVTLRGGLVDHPCEEFGQDDLPLWAQYEERQDGHGPFDEKGTECDGDIRFAPRTEDHITPAYEVTFWKICKGNARQAIGFNVTVQSHVPQLEDERAAMFRRLKSASGGIAC